MPIIAFQFFLPETYTLDKEYIRLKNDSEGSETKVTTSKMAMISRIVKTVLLNAFPGFPFYGSILLIPNILKEDNIKHDRDSPCHAIFGSPFLVVSLVFGVTHLVGKAIGYPTHKLGIPSAVAFTIMSAISTGSMIVVLLYQESVIIMIVGLSLVQTAIAASAVELNILVYDVFFISQSFLPISSGLRVAVDFMNSMFGNMASELLYYTVVLKLQIAASVGMLISGLLFFVKE